MLIPKDKQLHLAAGALACLVVGVFAGPGYGFLASAVAGAGKEGYDYVINRMQARKQLPPLHDVDVYDFLATATGGLIVAIAMELFNWSGL